MAQASIAQGLLTFAFTDIVGSTRLWERAPEAARQALARHNELLERDVGASRGKIFKTVGDACCCVFEDPAGALRAAVRIQRDLQLEKWPEDVGELRVRIGIHTGEAIAAGGDYFGPTLNRVARLTSAAHGGQILLSSAAVAALHDACPPEFSFVDLGSHRLKDLLEPQHIYQVVAEGLLGDFPAPATLDARPNNLPSQLSSFVGRTDELRELRELLDAHRLVTVSGVGGIGKTRLALQAAADTIGKYADGSWLVRLEDVTDPDLVAGTIASALRIPGVAGQSDTETLIDHLRARHAFLLLDNAEHVLVAAAAVVREVLASCSQISVLVTSREPLHLPGERVLRMNPLSAVDAAALFVNRAALRSADRYVERICDDLDRVPLAIEIAAAHVGALSTKQLGARLHTMAETLASKDASQEARHRTLQATVDWSYRLLNPKEQRFFAMLSAFEGGFTLEACESVAWAGEEDDPAYALLDALVDKSFVSAEPAGESMRYRLLDTLHRFASAKLRQSGDEGLARSLHFTHFKNLADRWGDWGSDAEQEAYLAELSAELPNLRAALEWGLQQTDTSATFELLIKVAMYWQQHCNIAEARSWLARACSTAAGTCTPLHAKLLRRASTFATIEDDYTAAREFTARAFAMFEELDDRAGKAEALHNLAVIEQRSGSEERALLLYADALQLFQECGHEIGIITALYNLALTSKHLGRIDDARRYLERGMALCTGAQHADRLATFWTLSAELAVGEGAFDAAAAALQRALQMKSALGDRHDQVEVLFSIAALEIRRSDLGAAHASAREALTLARDLGVPSLLVGCFEIYAVIFARESRIERAREVYALAKAMRSELGYVFAINDDLALDLAAFSDVLPCEERPQDRARAFIDELLAT